MEIDAFDDSIKQTTINVPFAALQLARSLVYPNLDVAYYLTRLEALVATARPLLSACTTTSEQVTALCSFLSDSMEFRGNRIDYKDPRNFYLNSVLDRKTGSPICLSIIFITLAQRLGLRAYGIGLPGHFIVGIYDDGSEIRVDPFNAGLRLSMPDCERLVRENAGYNGAFQPKWLKPVSPINLLGRLLTNLCNVYIERESWQKAIPVIQHLLLLQPKSDFHLRDLGYLYMYDGSLRLSAQYLEEYLRRTPDAPDFDNVLTSLQIVAGRLALWN